MYNFYLSLLSSLKQFRSSIFFILLLCAFNLFYMHIYISYEEFVSITFISFIDNILGVFIDISILLILSYFFTRRNYKITLCLTFFITCLWSFINVLYSNFFHHYITLSAIGQGTSLVDIEIAKCVIDGIGLENIFYILNTSLFFYLIRNTKSTNNLFSKILIILMVLFSVNIFSYIIHYSVIKGLDAKGIFGWYKYYHISHQLPLFDSNKAFFRRGNCATLSYEFILNVKETIHLTNDQKDIISDVIKKSKINLSGRNYNLSNRNLIFILVESYMSFVSEMKINGKEITPFLNSLKHDSTTYYNGTMQENVTIGESSDGQFIYLTGLFPLRSTITITKASKIKLYGLPSLIKKQSRMIIPTTAKIWSQDVMCEKYGFDNLYTSQDYSTGEKSTLNDEEVFELAKHIDKESTSPFFSVILTYSMHQPYNQQKDNSLYLDNSTLPKDLLCYLSACHYTDKQIGKYFRFLKSSGIYENSIIAIVSDHHVHNTDFGGVKKNIPIYLINLPHDLKDNMWKGTCNQVDVFTTLIDLFHVNSDWVGLGHSLLSTKYKSPLDSRKIEISDWIIMGNYFSER